MKKEFNSVQRAPKYVGNSGNDYRHGDVRCKSFSYSPLLTLLVVSFFCVGCYLYALGYAANEKNGKGRYKSGGGVKYIGTLTALFTSVYAGLSLAQVI